MNLPVLTTTYLSVEAIGQYSLVAFDAADDKKVGSARDGARLIIGVSTLLNVVEGAPADIVRSGFADVFYGDEVKAGDPLTANADGHAIPATAGDFIIGYAEESGALGDIGSVFIAPGKAA